MRLRPKLLISYILIASLVLIAGLIGIVTSRQIIEAAEVIVNSTSPSLNALSQIEAGGTNLAQSATQYALFGIVAADAVEDQAQEEAQLQQDQAELYNWFAQLKAVTNEPDTYEAIDAAAYDYLTSIENLINVSKPGGDQNEIYEAAEALEETEIQFRGVLHEAIADETAEFQQNLLHVEATASIATIINIVSMIAVVGAAVLAGVIVSGQIARPIKHLQEAADTMMQGDYTQRAEVETKDEIGLLAGAFNNMAEAVQKRDHELTEANDLLEKRIEERTKELRVATREAQEASRLKDEFLAVMSHELRTPLNAMIGFQGILLMTGKLDDKAKHMVRRAQANSNRLLTLINDILDVSRIESGRMQFVNSHVSLSELMGRLQSQMGVLAEEKSLSFTFNIDPSLPSTIWIDEDAITKILTNLMGNAFKFTEKGGVTVELSQEDTNLTIAVRDTGIGIPTHMHNIIFERFRQVDGSSKRTHGGSGLGLAIVQKLVSALNGMITVQSTVGEGSTFTVTLPLQIAVEKVAV